MPPLPDPHALFTMGLTIVALVLFSRDRIPLETSCLAVLVALVTVFFLAPYDKGSGPLINVREFFDFFGNQAVVAIACLMIVGKAMEMTGALAPIVRLMTSGWKRRPKTTLLLTLVTSAIASAFLNNTPIVVMMLPVLVAAGLRTNQSVSGLLMPMGLATIIGGMATTIGTSTNLMAVDIAADLGLNLTGLFHFTLPVMAAGVVGIAFLTYVAPRMLPERTPPMADTSPRVFSAMLHVTERSFPHGRTLTEVLAQTDKRMRVTRIQRGKDLYGEALFITKLPSVMLQPGDLLYVDDTPDRLKEYEAALQVTLHNVNDQDTAVPIDESHPLVAEGQSLAEVVVTRGSVLHHRTLNAVRFIERYGLIPLAIHRAQPNDVDTDGDIGEIQLRAGDVLLVQGSNETVGDLKRSGELLVLDGTSELPHGKRATRATIISGFVIGTAAFGLLPIAISAIIGVGMLILTNTLSWRNAMSALSVSVIMIIVTSLALSHALIRTGGAEYIAQVFVASTQGLPTPFILSGLMLAMAVLTNVVSNAAAAGIGTPIALSVANQIGAPAEPFFLAVLFGANMSFATPMGYQTNLLVMSAGGYRFSDFLRIGIPLTLIMWLSFSLILPIMYKL
ncbi:MAG: SLC13 family permease [Gammaproteobacteria bacterium]